MFNRVNIINLVPLSFQLTVKKEKYGVHFFLHFFKFMI